jgi:hypothetical protein
MKRQRIAGTSEYIEIGYYAVMTWRTLKIQDCRQSAAEFPNRKKILMNGQFFNANRQDFNINGKKVQRLCTVYPTKWIKI